MNMPIRTKWSLYAYVMNSFTKQMILTLQQMMVIDIFTVYEDSNKNVQFE